MYALGGQQRKAIIERMTHLQPENRARPGSGAIARLGPVLHDAPQRVQIALHACLQRGESPLPIIAPGARRRNPPAGCIGAHAA